jgi:hypothetical protein
MARRPGGLLDDPSENASRSLAELWRIGWSGDTQHLRVGFGRRSATHRRWVGAEGRMPNHELILRSAAPATTPGIDFDDSRGEVFSEEVGERVESGYEPGVRTSEAGGDRMRW